MSLSVLAPLRCIAIDEASVRKILDAAAYQIARLNFGDTFMIGDWGVCRQDDPRCVDGALWAQRQGHPGVWGAWYDGRHAAEEVTVMALATSHGVTVETALDMLSAEGVTWTVITLSVSTVSNDNTFA
jgi:hypothetical protein